MPLFGRKAEVALALDRDEVVAGEPVRATVTIGEPDAKVQGGRVELLYRNTYRYESTDSDGDRSNSRTTKDVVVQTVPLLEKGAAAGEVTVDLVVPPDAPGSDPRAVAWLVRAVLDRKRARDATAEAELAVLAPADALAAWAERPAEQPTACLIDVEAERRVLRPGDRVTGTVVVRATQEAVSARALRLDVRRLREDEDDLTDEDTVKQVLVEGVELAPGEERRVAFSADVPADAGPSFRAKHNEQHWLLEAVLDRPRSRDHVGRLEVLVVTAA